MLFSSTLLLLLPALSRANPLPEAPASPLSKLIIAARINATGIANIVSHDQARAKFLKEQGKAKKVNGDINRRQSSFPVTNGVVTYTADVGVGSPATTYSLIIDTGSSNTWVGSGKAYVRTSASTSSGRAVAVSYGSGSFSGTEFTDRVTLSSSLVIAAQSIGVASRSTGFEGVDGILGIGPVDLTEGTVQGVATVPTVTNNLFTQGTIPANMVSVFFAPTTSEEITNGELTFGGVDNSKITAPVVFTPITTTSPATDYWGINQSITYGSTSILATTAGIVDTGTTLVLIATNAFTRYRSATGAVADSATGLLRITAAQFAALQPLNFNVGGTTFALSPNAQIFPRALNTAIGGSASAIYLIVADLGTPSGEGFDFVDGYAFLERFYSVYDTTNRRVGFAPTAFTTATTN